MTASLLMERRKKSSRLWRLFVAFLGAIVLALPATPARAQLTVAPGWDLWITQPGATFGGVPFEGVPLGTFDFGGAIGVQNVGQTDTIVQRLAPAVVGGVPQTAPPIDLEIVALQLMSSVPANFGLGVGTYFVTLQSARGVGDPPGGLPSLGQMSITFNNLLVPPPQPANGVWASEIDVFFDVRLGALNGPIALSSSVHLSESNQPWSHFPGVNALLIDGVNHLLNGSNELADFHTIGVADHSGPHPVLTAFASAPEPGSIGLLMLGIGLMGTRFVRPRR